MGLTYIESIALQLPGMTEKERHQILWRLSWAELHRLATRYGIPQKKSKPRLITLLHEAIEAEACVATQAMFV